VGEEENGTVKCPHCLVDFHAVHSDVALAWNNARLVERDQTVWFVRTRLCSACGRAIVSLVEHEWVRSGDKAFHRAREERQVWPRGVARAPLAKEVTGEFKEDYTEACDVLADSAKASAALGRRCLQHVLREKAGVKKGNLHEEIEEVINGKTLPSDLAEALHHVRIIGNFAAHPQKSVNTGAIVDVEPGEAEWTLDVLESLFDFYFVRPARLAERKAELNKKLAEAGKPPLQ
jgi:hypothetical protein